MSDIALCKFVRAGDLDPEVKVLAPANQGTQDMFGKSKRDTAYNVTYKRSRSPRFHAFVMKIIRDMFENQEQYKDMEVFRTIIKIKCGWVYDEPILFADGHVQWAVKPTDWSNCGEDEFREFFSKLKPIILEKLGQAGMDQYRI